MIDDVLTQLHLDLDRDLKRIAKRFKSPKITLVVRNPQLADADVVLTDDDPELAIAAIRKLYSPSPSSGSLLLGSAPSKSTTS